MSHTCRTCKWWAVKANGKEGECRRHSPFGHSPTAHWPTTLYSHWCGEHSEVESAKQKNYLDRLDEISNTLQKMLDKIDDPMEIVIEESAEGDEDVG